MCKLVKITIFLAIVSIASFLSAANIMWNAGISNNPAAPVVGQVVTFTATFTVNPGPADNIRVIGGVDGVNIYDRRWARSFATNASQRINFTWTATAGNHRAFFTVDPDNVVRETNETDNTTEVNFNVSATGTVVYEANNNIAPVEMFNSNRPDLIIDSLSWLPLDIQNGETVVFTARVVNQGNRGTLRDFKVIFRIMYVNPNQTVEIGEGHVGALGPGQTMNVKLKVQFNATDISWLTPTNVLINAEADGYHVINETNENNNKISAYLSFR